MGVSENAEIDCDGGFLLVAVNKEKDVKNHLFEAAKVIRLILRLFKGKKA